MDCCETAFSRAASSSDSGEEVKFEVIGLDAAGAGVGAGVCVDGDEEVGLGLVGDRGAGLERDEGVVAAGEDDVRAETLPEQLAEPQRDIEDHILLFDAVGAERAGVMAAVTGIDHDASDLKPESANHRAAAVRGRLGFVDGR